MILKQLRIFLAVVEAGTVRQAAGRLHLSQSSVTKCIQQLEREMRAELFARSAQGVALTDAGRLLVARAKAIEAELRHARNELDAFTNAEAGDIRVPSLIVCGAEDKMTPPALSQDLEKRIPGARLELIENAGHFAMMEEPEAFNGILRAFVDALV